jgi:hypothetical protein
MPIIKSEFKPAWWLSNPHLQTVWPTFFKSLPDVHLSNKRIELADGDFIDLAKTDFDDKSIVLMLHGMEGSIESHYAKPLIKLLIEAGYAVCFMHFRGCSGELNRLPRGYSSADTDDLQSVIDSIQSDYGRKPFAIIGFSLGGSVLLKWLGEKGEKASTQTAIAVSVPFRLNDAADRLDQRFSRLYQKYLVSSCQKKYKQKFAENGSPLDVNVDELNTFYTFDDHITAPLHGFENADDYYQKCSSRQFLKNIQKPTLIIHAKDDPFMWKHTAPEETELSPAVHLELSESGGHVGFISGKFPWKAEYWLESRIQQWLENHK